MLVIQERDANNLPTVTSTRGRDLSGSLEGAGGIGGLLARTSNSDLPSATAHALYHADGNGNVTAMVNSQQLVVAKYIYDPFGNTLSKSGPLADANTYRFSSKDYHANSGLYYYGYRFYDPNLQRWPNRDPLGDFAVGSLLRYFGRYWDSALRQPKDGVNLYEFALNDPIGIIDPDGLEPKKIPIAFWEECDSYEEFLCGLICAPKPVKSCSVAKIDGVVVARSCICGDPPPDRKKPKPLDPARNRRPLTPIFQCHR